VTFAILRLCLLCRQRVEQPSIVGIGQIRSGDALGTFDGPVLREAVSNQGERGAAMTTLNGWQRLWLLASILWAVVILVLAGILQSDGNQAVPSANGVLFVVRLWIVPVAAVYGLGLGLAWVRRGFQVESK
jgi:hypothetical protein